MFDPTVFDTMNKMQSFKVCSFPCIYIQRLSIKTFFKSQSISAISAESFTVSCLVYDVPFKTCKKTQMQQCTVVMLNVDLTILSIFNCFPDFIVPKKKQCSEKQAVDVNSWFCRQGRFGCSKRQIMRKDCA